MPSFLTHCLFAEDSLELIKDEQIKKIIKNRMALYYLGAQGPDIFFYYKAKPWVKYDGIEKLGYIMHDNKTSNFFINSFNYIKKIKNSKNAAKNADEVCDFSSLMTYIIGYLCHFALDLTTHPLIHYLAGIDTQKNKKTHKYHNYHKLLESIIDVYMLKYKKNIQAHKFKSYSLIEDSRNYTSCLGSFYNKLIKEVYNFEITQHQAFTAVYDIIEILKILYDPTGLKKIFFKCLEFILNKKGEITTAIHPHNLNSKVDYLNLNHKPWLHPCTKDCKSSKSFIDLYNEALLLAEKYINAAINYIMDKETLLNLKNIIPDISYSTGLKCGTDKDLIYFNSIFEDKFYF